MPFVDNKNDFDFIPEDENEGVEKSLDFTSQVMFGRRFRMSCYQMAVYHNLVVKSLGIDDPTKLVSPKGMSLMIKRLSKSAVKTHEKKCEGLLEVDFDGTTTPEALPHNKRQKTHFLGITDGLGGYVHHEKSPKNGKGMAEIVSSVIHSTKSEESLLMSGSGKV